MANKYYGLSSASFIDLLSAALTDKYGAGVTINYTDENNIVFSCPAISDKVIKINWTHYVYTAGAREMDYLKCYYGDAWTLDTTITNQVQVSGDSIAQGAVVSALWTFTTAELVLGDSFLYISFDGSVPQSALFGKLSNGKFVAMGWNPRLAYNVNCHGYLTDGSIGEVEAVTLSSICNDAGKFVVMPLLFTQAGALILNTDASYATIAGIYNAAYKTNVVAETFYSSRVNAYTATNNLQLVTSLFFLMG